MWTIFKVFIELLQYCFCFMFWVFWFFFGCKACGILALPPGIEPTPSALEGSLNHQTTKEVPSNSGFQSHYFCKTAVQLSVGGEADRPMHGALDPLPQVNYRSIPFLFVYLGVPLLAFSHLFKICLAACICAMHCARFQQYNDK